VDNIAPKIKSAEYDSDNNEIKVVFSEAMDKTTAEDIDNYTLVDRDGDRLRIRNALLDDDQVTLELRDEDPELGTYKLTVQDVKM
jgi:hypothetical protein